MSQREPNCNESLKGSIQLRPAALIDMGKRVLGWCNLEEKDVDLYGDDEIRPWGKEVEKGIDGHTDRGPELEVAQRGCGVSLKESKR